MARRGAFVAGAAAVVLGAAVAPARAEETTLGSPHATTPTAQTILDAVTAIEATRPFLRTVWRPPAAFPPSAPVAYYAGVGGDPDDPQRPAIWLNPDHPELISPHVSRLTDEIPLLTELLLAVADVRPNGAPSLGLETLPPAQRHAAATKLASDVAVIAKYTVYPAVDDTTFAKRAFAFAVLRQMTPGIGGVATVPTPPAKMPWGEPYAAYMGRDADARVPRGWGTIRVAASGPRGPLATESLVRAYVLATADRLADGEVKSAYDAADMRDMASNGRDGWAARRIFARPYVAQVEELFGT